MTASIIRAMVIDDEEPARSEIRYLLEQHDDVCIVYETGHFQDALAALRQTRPHLVFLDIEMPGMNGIILAEKIQEILQPLIVFATAHEEFAHKAFELNAADYLLKPFAPKRVAQCIDKVRALLSARAPVPVSGKAGESESRAACRQKLAVEQNGKAQIINTADIIAASSSEGQVTIYSVPKTFQVNITLQDLQAKLDESQFFRSHRGYLVNIEKIREVIPWFNGTYNLVMDGLTGIEIPVSRQQAPKLKKIFGL